MAQHEDFLQGAWSQQLHPPGALVRSCSFELPACYDVLREVCLWAQPQHRHPHFAHASSCFCCSHRRTEALNQIKKMQALRRCSPRVIRGSTALVHAHLQEEAQAPLPPACRQQHNQSIGSPCSRPRCAINCNRSNDNSSSSNTSQAPNTMP